MYEKKHAPPLSHKLFIFRVILHFAISIGILAVSLLIGICGYEHFENLSVTDSFLNSAMLLGGMGPVNPPQTESGKIFAGIYALYAGLVFLLAFGVALTPIIHRILHKFHLDQDK